MSITQAEYDFLIKQEKVFEDTIQPISLGPAPIQWTRQVNSISTKEIFQLDFYRGSFELTRFTYNKRYRQTIILIRYDSRGRHTNPDGQYFDGPHVHFYREGFNDKFAYPISEIGCLETDTMEDILIKLFAYCSVKKYPSIEISMF
jgi:hypothetical protein